MTRYRTVVLGLAFLALFATTVARLVVSPLVPEIIAAFGTSKGAFGLVLTGMWAASALVQYPGGALGDRFGERRVILAGVGLTAAGSVALALSPTLAVFALAAALLGVGVGLYFPVGAALLTEEFEDTGRALGFHNAAGPVAGLLAPALAAAVAVRYGWRAGLLLGAVVAVAVLALAAAGLRPTPPSDGGLREHLDAATAAGLLARPSVAYTTFIAAITGFVWQSFVSFFPTFLVEYHGFDARGAAVLLGVVFAFSAVGLPVVGALSDRFTRDGVLAVVLCLVALGFALFVLVSTLPGFVVATAVLGSGMNWGGVLHSRYMDAFSTAERGTGFGLVRTVSVLLGSAGNAVTGVVADAAGWPVAYGIVVGLLGLAVGAILLNRISRLGL